VNLSSLIHNEVLQLIVAIAEIVGLLTVIYKIVASFFWPRLSRGRKAAQIHFEKIIGISSENDAYLSACVLILLTRILTSLFFVLASATFLLLSLSSGRSGFAEGIGWLNRLSPTGNLPHGVSLLFVALSCILFIGNVVSATNFSRAVRRKVDPKSVKAPFARAFFGLDI
jgi:hypothetical protein